MIRKTISMPDEMDHWVSDRIKSGQYNNDSEYFRDLVRRDQEKEIAQRQLQSLLNDAENSGISDRSVDDIWAEAEKKTADSQWLNTRYPNLPRKTWRKLPNTPLSSSELSRLGIIRNLLLRHLNCWLVIRL